MAEEKIGLAEMIGNLREELQTARDEGVGEQWRFGIEEVELELQVGITKKGKGKGGVKFWVYNAEVEGELASQKLHKICLKLKPEHISGDDTIADTDTMPQD